MKRKRTAKREEWPLGLEDARADIRTLLMLARRKRGIWEAKDYDEYRAIEKRWLQAIERPAAPGRRERVAR